jgi:hypothetical protein
MMHGWEWIPDPAPMRNPGPCGTPPGQGWELGMSGPYRAIMKLDKNN